MLFGQAPFKGTNIGELENDIKKSKNRTLIRYFKKYDKARLELQHASAMLTRAFDLERR